MDDPEEIQLKEVKGLAEEKNIEFIPDPDTRNKLITALKVAEDADYGRVVSILDELNLAEIKITEETQKVTGEDGAPAERARRFAISIMNEKDYEEFLTKLNGEGE